MAYISEADELHSFLTTEPRTCYYCGGSIAGGFVMWRSEPIDIFLHPKCAVFLGAHLIMDARSSEHDSERLNLLGGIFSEGAE